ncbi:discoidin domain-containing protein [Snuella sedimenti]|uniref:Discoidin domain-containing protein n=1 Tax=Snuella sedimenti TaxID=2798802 RepID=A0A8J7ISS1_9FLAO|nr:discoidin domain-containing protein [Snuella sedimenti]MBJ6367250.1 discoidin domain-containing protein [Snuella sedimenti]
MKSLKIKKKITLIVAAFFTMVTFVVLQSCDPDKILITDTDLELPPVPLNTTGWVVIDYTSQEDQDGEGAGNGRVFNTFDGDPSTFWHTCWAGCTAVPPHYFVIDMLESKNIDGFNFVQRQSLSRNIEILSVDISNDNSSWTSLGEFTLEKVKASQDKPLETSVQARYFRINVVKVFDGTNNAALAEVAPYSRT